MMMARVILRKAPIVVMDDATSNLNEKADAVIQSVLRKKLNGATIINATKKLENILDYDQIIVFDKG